MPSRTLRLSQAQALDVLTHLGAIQLDAIQRVDKAHRLVLSGPRPAPSGPRHHRRPAVEPGRPGDRVRERGARRAPVADDRLAVVDLGAPP
ncbi:hypothetical protein GCM10010176_074560 [Nonomuraea spiralis]|nr:hypothetical protein GCM10010176_074560 [Nonomuraea spiralis]